MNETTTTRAALESRAQKNARRAAAAHARHAAPSYDTMTATTGEHGTIFPALHDMTPRGLYHLPELCAALVIRARHRETGLQLFADLQRAAGSDARIMHDLTDRAQRAADRRAEYETARDNAAALDQIAARISTAPDVAEAAAEAAAEERDRRDAAREDAEAIDRADAAATTSERAAIVQAAAARLTEMMRNGDDLTSAIPELCRAASAALAQLANPDALTRCTTVTRWMTRAEWDAIRARYAYDLTAQPAQHIPAASTKTGASCYKTVEIKDRKAERAHLAKHDPAELDRRAVTADGQAICLVYHYRTAAPYVTFSSFAAPDSAPELSTNGGINAIMTQGDRDSLTSLFDRANLTDRERAIVMYAASQTADRRAAAAYKDAMQAAADSIAATDSGHRAQARKRAQAAADKDAAAARWAYAFDRLSRTDSGTKYSTATRDKYRRRIAAALDRARTAPEAPTAADRAEADRRAWEQMQRSSRRAAAAQQSARPDIFAATAAAAAAVQTGAPAVRFLSKAQASNRRAAADRRAAEIAAASRIDTTTPEAQAAAEHAAKLYGDKMRSEAQRKRESERAAAKATAMRYPHMIKTGVYSLSTTFEQWHGWTDAERAEHRRYLDTLSKI